MTYFVFQISFIPLNKTLFWRSQVLDFGINTSSEQSDDMDSSEFVLWDGVIELTALLHSHPILLLFYLVTGITSSFKKFVRLVSFHISWAQLFLRLECTNSHDFSHPKLDVMSGNFRYNFYWRNIRKWFIWRWKVIVWLLVIKTPGHWPYLRCKNVTWLKNLISILTLKKL